MSHRTIDRESEESHVVVAWRPLGSPVPLAFLALALVSGTLGTVELSWISTSGYQAVGLIALLVTAPLQIIASVLSFWARDPVVGTGTGILGASWAVTGVITLINPSSGTSPGLGVYLIGAAVALTVPLVSGWSNPLAAAVIGVAALRFVVTGIYKINGYSSWQTASGAVGIALFAVALYAAYALELEGAHSRPILPVFRPSSTGTDNGEPGVRDHL